MGRFQQLAKQTFTGLPLDLEFDLNIGKREFGKMQFEGFHDADQNRSSLSSAKRFASTTGSSILSGIAQ